MAFEFLRIGRNDIPTLSKSLSSAVVTGVAISFFQMLLIGVIFLTGILTFLLGEAGTTDFSLVNTAALALIVQGTSWLINTTVPAYLTRALAPFGYYPRFMWWGLAFTISRSSNTVSRSDHGRRYSNCQCSDGCCHICSKCAILHRPF